MNGIDITNVSLWGDDWSNLFGVCLFNFAVVVAIPAWLYEKKPSVNVSTGKFYRQHDMKDKMPLSHYRISLSTLHMR